MALIATVGASDANSYVTLDEASAYFEDRANSSDWDAYEQQEQILITSSRLLDWYVNWKGDPTDEDVQSMDWPRTGVTKKNGTSVASDIIPIDVKIAVYELALSSLSADRLAEDPLAGIEQVKAGSLMIKADNGDIDSTASATIPEQIWKILSDLYSRGDVSIVRLVRA